jgi:hypothetical protein
VGWQGGGRRGGLAGVQHVHARRDVFRCGLAWAPALCGDTRGAHALWLQLRRCIEWHGQFSNSQLFWYSPTAGLGLARLGLGVAR